MLRQNDRVQIPGVPVWHSGTVTQVLARGRVVITWDTITEDGGRKVRARHEFSRERAEAIERSTHALQDTRA